MVEEVSYRFECDTGKLFQAGYEVSLMFGVSCLAARLLLDLEDAASCFIVYGCVWLRAVSASGGCRDFGFRRFMVRKFFGVVKE